MLLLLALPGAARTQEASPTSLPQVDVFYPQPQTLTESRYITVEGMVLAPVNEIKIVVNGEDDYRVIVNRFLFSESVRLVPGVNLVTVAAVSRRVYFLEKGAAAPPPEYKRFFGHLDLVDGCRECHQINSAARLSLAGERGEICGWCHRDLVRGPGGKAAGSVHAPVNEGKCLRCHTPHLSVKRGLPADVPPTCADCHAPVYKALATDRYVHGPLNLGDCRLCHTVHSSPEPALLVRSAKALCLECHSDAVPPAESPAALQPHTMIPQGECSRCHFAHSSSNPWRLRQPPGRLCQGCHIDKTRSFHEKQGFSIYICSKCHTLHRPTQPHLVKDASRSLCQTCHPFGEQEGFTHSFVREGRCFLCHTFHEASLRGDVATTCLECHRGNPALQAAPRRVPSDRSRCTGCHLPHQSRKPKLLQTVEHTPFAKRECDLCHRERSGKIGALTRLLCLDCHVKLDPGALRPPPTNIHPPFQDKDCSHCHRSHSSEAAKLLVQNEKQLCLECHRKLKKTTILVPKSAHASFTEGRCGDCHSPHFSNNAALLLKSPLELCGGCHPAVGRNAAGAPWKVLHAPVRDGQCRACHRPHTSVLAALQVVAGAQQCRACHQQFFASLESKTAKSRHAPVLEESCFHCHAVHGSDTPGLLKPDGRQRQCEGCHWERKDKHHLLTIEQLKAEPGGEEAEARGCLLCHVPHASESKRLMQPADRPVCKGCHKK